MAAQIAVRVQWGCIDSNAIRSGQSFGLTVAGGVSHSTFPSPGSLAMPNAAVVQLIAANLPHLTHPGDGKGGEPTPIVMPMFRNTNMPPEMAEQFAKDAGLPHSDIAKLFSEAVVHLLESNGFTVTSSTEIEQLQRAAVEREPQKHRVVAFQCTCHAPLFKANVTDFDTDQARISPQVIKALRSFSPECALGHAAVSA